MASIHRTQENLGRIKSDIEHTRIQGAQKLMDDGKKLVDNLYQDSLDKVEEGQVLAKEYSDELLKKVKANPLSSLIMAAGIGFLLSLLLKK